MKYLLFIVLIHLIRPVTLFSQDELNDYRDDDAYKNLVYVNIQNAMQKTHVKGTNELKNQTITLKENSTIQFKSSFNKTAQNISYKLKGSQIYNNLKKSVFSVWKFYRKTEKNIQGIAISATAFAIGEDGTLVTNTHVLENILDPNGKVYEMDSCVFLSDIDGHVYSIDSILTYNNNSDLAIFKIKNLERQKITPISFSSSAQIGEPIWLLSNPYGYPYYFTCGIVSRKQLYKKYGDGSARIDITADYAVGSSGGPIVNDKGELVSIVCSTFTINGRNNTEPQMVIKETIPVYLLEKLLINKSINKN